MKGTLDLLQLLRHLDAVLVAEIEIEQRKARLASRSIDVIA